MSKINVEYRLEKERIAALRNEAIDKGAHKYDTGKPCKSGHLADRYIKSNKCVDCVAVVSHKQRLKNPEKRKVKAKEWRENNKEKLTEYFYKYYRDNKEHKTQYAKDYREANSESLKQKDREYAVSHKEQIREYKKKYAIDNKEKISLKQAENYIKNRETVLPKAIQYQKDNKESVNAKHAKRRADKLQRTPKWCNLVETKEVYKNCPEGFHVDHIHPLIGKLVSGLHVETNLQYLSGPENNSKSNKFTPYRQFPDGTIELIKEKL